VTPIVRVEGVAKSFRVPSVHRQTIREHVTGFWRPRAFDRLQVLDGVSFEVQPGEAVAILGRNGSGKSTLLKILSGIYLPDRGRLHVGGPVTPILELGLGWNLDLDAVDNILLVATVMGMSLQEARGAVDEILAFAELERFANMHLKHYSNGMASRLAYAVAFRAARDILVLDEIFAVGDAGFRHRCEQRYKELSSAGHTIIVVTHDERPIAFCSRALLLEGGRIVLEDEPSRVWDAYEKMLVSSD